MLTPLCSDHNRVRWKILINKPFCKFVQIDSPLTFEQHHNQANTHIRKSIVSNIGCMESARPISGNASIWWRDTKSSLLSVWDHLKNRFLGERIRAHKMLQPWAKMNIAEQMIILSVKTVKWLFVLDSRCSSGLNFAPNPLQRVQNALFIDWRRNTCTRCAKLWWVHDLVRNTSVSVSVFDYMCQIPVAFSGLICCVEAGFHRNV